MPFDIPFQWNNRAGVTREQVETLADRLSAAFSCFELNRIDTSILAKDMGLDAHDLPEVELTDVCGDLLGASILIGVKNIFVALPSDPGVPIASAIELLEPLFSEVRRDGAEILPGFVVDVEWQSQYDRVYAVARITGGTVNTSTRSSRP